LATGTPLRSLAGGRLELELLDIAPAAHGAKSGTFIHIDGYGNATTNVPAENLRGVGHVHVKRKAIPLHRTYGDVAAGKPLALIGSSGLLEIAVREGSAAAVLRLCVGDTVKLLR
jgi:S-adenosylmethionine hydrolase